MKRTTIFIDEGVERDLRAYADREGRSAASVVREAISEYLTRKRPPGRLGFVAAGRSGRSDVAERHEELLWADESRSTAGPGSSGDRETTRRGQAVRRSKR